MGKNNKPLFADFDVRGVALFIDIIIIEVLLSVIRSYTIYPEGQDLVLVNVAVFFIYFTGFWASAMMATPAQFILGLRIVDRNVKKLDIKHAALRSVIKIVVIVGLIAGTINAYKDSLNFLFTVILLLTFILTLIAAITVNRQAGHDILAQSIVIKKGTLKSPASRAQLLEHLADADLATRNQRRPSVFSVIGNMIVFAVPVFLLMNASIMMHDREMLYRTIYAVEKTNDLKLAVMGYHEKFSRWPTGNTDLGISTRADYPDGGYYELEDDGVIRIHFTVLPELKNGTIVFTPKWIDNHESWECHSEGDIAIKYLPSKCRK